MLDRLRCYLSGRGCAPAADAGERGHEPAIHESRNARQRMRTTAEATVRLVERERREAETTRDALFDLWGTPPWRERDEARDAG